MTKNFQQQFYAKLFSITSQLAGLFLLRCSFLPQGTEPPKIVRLYESIIWITLINIIFVMVLEKVWEKLHYDLPLPYRINLLFKPIVNLVSFIVPNRRTYGKEVDKDGRDSDGIIIQPTFDDHNKYAVVLYVFGLLVFLISFVTALFQLYPRYIIRFGNIAPSISICVSVYSDS